MINKLLKIEYDPKRIYGLDILRAFAIISVLLAHGLDLLPKSLNWFVIPVQGVDVFFVLSGFLIGGILIKILHNNNATFSVLLQFWIRRWFRTIPNYILILCTVLILSVRYTPNFNPFNYLNYFIFCQNVISRHPNFFGEAWSLAVEEWFYLITPVLIFLLISILKGRQSQSIIISAITIIFLSFCFRYAMFIKHPPITIDAWDVNFRKIVACRLDSLMFGVIGAYISFYFNSFWIKHKISLFFIGIVLAILPVQLQTLWGVFGFYSCVVSFSMFSIGVLCCLPYLSQLKSGKGFLRRLITHISLISYSLYLVNFTLVHQFIILDFLQMHILYRLSENIAAAVSYSVFWFVSIILSTILYKHVELPCMNLRDRIKKNS